MPAGRFAPAPARKRPLVAHAKLHTNAPRQAPHLSEHGLEAQSKPRYRGMIATGNIRLKGRPPVLNHDGSFSTVRSISVGVGHHEVLIPTVVHGRVVSNRDAIAHYSRTGEHLGIFDSPASANRYAQVLHEHEAKRVALALAPYRPGGSKAAPYTVHELAGEPTLGEFLKSSRPPALQKVIDKQQADVRAARARMPKPLKLGFDVGRGFGFDKHLAGDVVNATYGAIPGTVELIRHPTRVGRQIVEQYKRNYGPLRHGHVQKFLNQVYEHPLPFVTDATVVGAGVGKVADIGAMTAKGGVRAGLRTAVGKETAVPRERFVHYGGNPQGRFAVGPEGAKSTVREAPTPGKMQFVASPTTATRFLEHKFDRFSEKHPDLPRYGASARIARRVPFVYERALDRAEEPAIAFSRARRPLARSKRKDVAYALLHVYGDKALERTDQEIRMREARLKGKAGPHSQEPADLIERANQAKTLLLLKSARPLVANPPRAVVRALQHGVPLSHEGQKLKIEMGELQPETAAQALDRQSRMVTGGRFHDLPAPTKALQSARIERDRLLKQHEKAIAKRDENLRKLLAKETAKSQRPVPLTLGEAQAKLKGLEAQHEEIVKKVETSLREHEVTPQRAQQLVAEHDARIAAARQTLASRQARVDALEQRGKAAAAGNEWRPLHRLLSEAKSSVRTAEKAVQQLERERKPYEQALATGKYRPPHDKAETARRNLARRSGLAVPTLAEELRDAAHARIDALIKAQPNHPVVKRLLELRSQIEHLSGGVQGVNEITGGLAGGEFGRQARRQELEGLLGHRPAGEQPPGRLGQRVETQGAWLRASGHAKAERLGGALSIAQDRVQQLEARALRKHGVVPGRTGGRELLGGEPTGEGAGFMPDVARMRGHRFSRVARNVTSKRQPIVHKSGGILFGEGRARRGSRVVLEDFLRTARTNVRDQQAAEAAKFARPLEPSAANPQGLLPGHEYYNPEGLAIARRQRELINEDTLLGSTPGEVEKILNDRRKALESAVFPNALEVKGLTETQKAKLLQIDSKIATAYKGGRLRLAAEDHPFLHGLVSALDLSNNLSRMGVLYLKGAFVPANFIGNTAFGVIHQQHHYPANLLRGLPPALRGPAVLRNSHMLGDLKAETLRRLDTEVGSGAAVAVAGHATGPLGRTTAAIAHFSNMLADQLPRRAAIIYELRRRGIKSDAQVNALLDRARGGDSAATAKLNQVGETAENAMVKFRGMNPDVRAVITRAIFIAPWLVGATRYVLRLPLDRPVQAALIEHIGEAGRAWQKHQLGDVPSYLDQLVPWGPAHKAFGTSVMPVKNPVSVTPVGSAGDVAKALGYFAATHQLPTSDRPVQYLQPGIRGGLEAITGHDFFLGRDYPASMGPAEIFLKSTVGSFPAVSSYRAAFGDQRPREQSGSPASQALYIPEKHGWGTFARDLGLGSLRTRNLNLPAAHAKAASDRRGLMNPQQRVAADVTELRKTLTALGGKPPPEVEQALKVYQLRAANRLKASKDKHGKLDTYDRFVVDGKTLVGLHKISREQFEQGKTAAAALWTTGLRPDGSSPRRDGKPLTPHERSSFLSGEIGKLAPLFGWDLLTNARKNAERAGHDVKLPRLP